MNEREVEWRADGKLEVWNVPRHADADAQIDSTSSRVNIGSAEAKRGARQESAGQRHAVQSGLAGKSLIPADVK